MCALSAGVCVVQPVVLLHNKPAACVTCTHCRHSLKCDTQHQSVSNFATFSLNYIKPLSYINTNGFIALMPVNMEFRASTHLPLVSQVSINHTFSEIGCFYKNTIIL